MRTKKESKKKVPLRVSVVRSTHYRLPYQRRYQRWYYRYGVPTLDGWYQHVGKHLAELRPLAAATDLTTDQPALPFDAGAGEGASDTTTPSADLLRPSAGLGMHEKHSWLLASSWWGRCVGWGEVGWTSHLRTPSTHLCPGRELRFLLHRLNFFEHLLLLDDLQLGERGALPKDGGFSVLGSPIERDVAGGRPWTHKRG